MKLYADAPSRRLRQALGDAFVLAWTVLWVRLGVETHQQVERLGTPGRQLEQAGGELSQRLTAAGDRAGGLPIVGDRLRDALSGAGSAGSFLTDAGRSQQNAVGGLARLLAVLVALLPIAVVLARWLPRRLGWLREASSARQLALTPDGLEILAVRALTLRPLGELATLSPGAVRAWRGGDPAATRALAALELRALGVVGEAALPEGQRQHP